MGSLGSDIPALATVLWATDVASDARLSAHTVTPFSAASLDPAAPDQVTSVNVVPLFWGTELSPG